MNSPRHLYITTTIPYVNAAPHIGFALELVIADAIARHHRLRGDDVRCLTGTDENGLKNARAAQDAGVSTTEWVGRNSTRFTELKGTLNLAYDDFIRTSVDPRHAPGVHKLWNACADAGDIYKAGYEGLYCVGCEQFFLADEPTGASMSLGRV